MVSWAAMSGVRPLSVYSVLPVVLSPVAVPVQVVMAPLAGWTVEP